MKKERKDYLPMERGRNLMSYIKYNLDFSKTLPYFFKRLRDGHTLSNEILKTIELKNGFFFTFISFEKLRNEISSSLDKDIYDFCFSINKRGPQTQITIGRHEYKGYETITLKDELCSYIYDIMKANAKISFLFEDVQKKTTDKHVDFFLSDGLLFKNEIYYLINKNNFTFAKIDRALEESDALWHFSCVGTDTELGDLDRKLTEETIALICKHVKYLIVDAYDCEGYIIWEQASFHETHNQHKSKKKPTGRVP